MQMIRKSKCVVDLFEVATNFALVCYWFWPFIIAKTEI